MKNPIAILTADFHLTDKQPLCRTDADWWETMRTKLRFIRKLSRAHMCPVIHAGDLFNTWKPSPELMTFAVKELPTKFFTVLGNHDLPQHNLDLYYKSGVATLAEAGRITVIPSGVHWGMDLLSDEVIKSRNNIEEETDWRESQIIVAHYMVRSTAEKPWLGCVDPPASKVLRTVKVNGVDLILVGHNHKSFVEEYKGKLLVNPGSIFRMDADQIDYQPKVYLWYDDPLKVEAVLLPIEDSVTRHHLETEQAKNDRIKQFITNLQDTWEPGFSLEENLRQAFKSNKTSKSVQDIIWQALDTK